MRVCRITEIRNRTTQITEDIRQLEQDSEDAQGKAGRDLYLMFVCHRATYNLISLNYITESLQDETKLKYPVIKDKEMLSLRHFRE